MEVWSQVLGRFHPLVVHLPIGILLLTVIIEWLSVQAKWQILRPAIPLLWGVGALSAIIACISGYLMANSGTYELKALGWHQWAALSFAIYSSIVFLFRRKKDFRNGRFIALITLIWLSIAGHLGGSLTHGTEFLLAPFSGENASRSIERQTIVDLKEAFVYEDIIAPILRSKCTSCHGPSKQKGKLALHVPKAIQKGGKSGSDVLATDPMVIGRPANNTIYHRINLPLQDDERMPPKDKTQLSKTEKQLLEWWLHQKAPFTKKVVDLNPTDSIWSFLHHWNEHLEAQNSRPPIKNVEAALPDVQLPPLDPSSLAQIRQHDILILPVGKGSPLVEVNFINADRFSDSLFARLTPLKKHVVRLKLSGQPITDQHLQLVGQMKNLTRLYLDHTSISDDGLKVLSELKYLRFLNLVGTRVSEKGLAHLQDLPRLEHIYGFLTNVKSTHLKNQLLINTGGYLVPTLATDTTLIPQN